MERETKKLTTPGGKELIVKAWLTARERNAIRNVMVSLVSVDDLSAGTPKMSGISGDLLDRFHQAAVEQAVISYDGSLENILARFLDGRAEEYDFAVAEAVAVADFKSAK